MRYLLSTEQCDAWEIDLVYPTARSEEITVEAYVKGNVFVKRCRVKAKNLL